MNDIITRPVNQGHYDPPNKFTVNGRDLQKRCGSTKHHTDWAADQIKKGDLKQGIDFITLEGRSTGGRPSTTYWFTPEVAAIIQSLSRTQEGTNTVVAMVQHIVTQKHHLAIPKTYGEALLAYAQEVVKTEALEADNTKLQATVAGLLETQPTESRIDAQIKAKGEFTLRELAKSLDVGPNKLNEVLSGHGPIHDACKAIHARHRPIVVIYMHRGKWVPTESAKTKGWARMHTPLVGDKTGAYTVITPKGMVRIREYLKHLAVKKMGVDNAITDLFGEDKNP